MPQISPPAPNPVPPPVRKLPTDIQKKAVTFVMPERRKPTRKGSKAKGHSSRKHTSSKPTKPASSVFSVDTPSPSHPHTTGHTTAAAAAGDLFDPAHFNTDLSPTFADPHQLSPILSPLFEPAFGGKEYMESPFLLIDMDDDVDRHGDDSRESSDGDAHTSYSSSSDRRARRRRRRKRRSGDDADHHLSLDDVESPRHPKHASPDPAPHRVAEAPVKAFDVGVQCEILTHSHTVSESCSSTPLRVVQHPSTSRPEEEMARLRMALRELRMARLDGVVPSSECVSRENKLRARYLDLIDSMN
eukprot:gnl/Dysnectes_brevis/5514_a7964_471.p1 GENE.gnl/Dysnectes_brevis/5514_a7964_471~~gnl/Dysnectes_brevis/5514_a7964_471.p1  ORF type:complete len:329 (+),score=49.97 gnl/Dysnectes_brevis/5514_a7964_471:86-988(+)